MKKEARLLSAQFANDSASETKTVMTGNEFLRRISRKNETNEFNVLIKADVQGSLTSVLQSIQSLTTEEVTARVVGSGVGTINENDVHLAKTAGAVIYGFQTSLPAGIRQLAGRDGVSVRLYDVIYELLDDMKVELSKLLAPEVRETVLGTLTIKKIFRTTKKELIVGGEVTSGKLSLPATVKILRDKEVIGEAELIGLQRGQSEAKEIIEGELCGVSLRTSAKFEVLESDKLEFITRELVQRSI